MGSLDLPTRDSRAADMAQNMFWFCSVPGGKDKNAAWSNVNKVVSSFGATCHKIEIPNLKVGTLDALMLLVDELEKMDAQVHNVLKRIARSYECDVSDESHECKLSDLKVPLPSRAGSGSQSEVTPTDFMLKQFRWRDEQFPPKGSLHELVQTIYGNVTQSEDEVKGKQVEYQTVKNQLALIKRKFGGNLMVKSLDGIVNETHYVTHDDGTRSEKIIPVFVVINKQKENEFLDEYESMTTEVVPRSYRKIQEDESYVLARVLHLNCATLDQFKDKCAKSKVTVRDFSYDEKAVEANDAEERELTLQEKQTKKEYRNTLLVMFGEVFLSHLHLKAVFLFAESVLWYGLPPNFQAVVIQVNPKKEGALRKELNSKFPFSKGAADDKEDSTEDSFVLKESDMDYLLLGQ